jgi:hypothetical protein
MNLDMVDNNVTHMFIRGDVVQKHGFHYGHAQTSFKVTNSREQDIGITTKDFTMKLGDWVGRTSFIVVPLDNYEVILGHDFLWIEKAVPILHANCLAIMSR